jgi:hypothetical protein
LSDLFSSFWIILISTFSLISSFLSLYPFKISLYYLPLKLNDFSDVLKLLFLMDIPFIQ